MPFIQLIFNIQTYIYCTCKSGYVFCHSRLFWYKILNTKNREVCKIRKRLILTINEGFLYAFIYYYNRIDKHGKFIKFIVLRTEVP